MQIKQIKELPSTSIKNNQYQAIFSYDDKYGLILLNKNTIISQPSGNKDAIKSENKFKQEVMVSSLTYSLNLNELYIEISGTVSGYFITNYDNSLYLLKVIVIPTFIEKRVSFKRLDDFLKNYNIFSNGKYLDKFTLTKNSYEDLFLISKSNNEIKKITFRYIETTKRYEVVIYSYDTLKLIKEEVDNIIKEELQQRSRH